MYYMYKADCSKQCVYVYDDSDKSVMLVDRYLLGRAGIQFAGEIDFGVANVSMLRMYGFNGMDTCDFIAKPLCVYKLGDMEYKIVISIFKDTGVCFLLLYSYESLDMFNVSELYFYDAKLIFGGMSMLIPASMVFWLLHLYSIKDFDKIMVSFNNLLGSNASDIFRYVKLAEPVFKEWL